MGLTADSILFPEGKALPAISACDHYAGSEKLILKSFEIQNSLGGAFDITCDLEDGAQSGNERALRTRFLDIISSDLNQHACTGLRVHDFTSPFFEEDVAEALKVCGKVLTHITVPKVLSFSQAQEIVGFIKRASLHAKLESPLPVHLLIETHQALHDVWNIAALPGLRGLDFGIMDFISAHHGAISDQYMRSPGQFEHPLLIRAKTEITAACLAHSIIPAHNVTTEFNDADRAFDDALRARVHFGFLRMWSIHPNQIKPIIDAYKPDSQEITVASKILVAAQHAAWGPIRHNDHLHDKASYRYYWNLLKRAKKAGMELPIETTPLFTETAQH